MRIIYMRYAVQVATEIEKTTYYPEEIDRMKKTTRRRKIEIKIEKSTNQNGEREKKALQARKQESKKGNTRERRLQARRLQARTLREGCRTGI